MARPNRRHRARLAEARRKEQERARRARAAADGRPSHAFELALPIPPGATPDEIAAVLADFRAEVEALGMELGPVRVCASPDCPHTHCKP